MVIVTEKMSGKETRKGADGVKYGFVVKENRIVASFRGEGKNFDMAAHAFMMSGYGIKRVSAEEYQAEKEKKQQ